MASVTASVLPTPGSPVEHNVDAVFRDYITKQRVVSLTSMRPVHQHCLEQERFQIVRALIKIRQWVQPQYLLCLRVDEVLCRIPRAD